MKVRFTTIRLDGSTISDLANNAFNGGQVIDVSSFTTIITTGINPPDAILGLTAATGTTLNEVILKWDIPDDLNNDGADASSDLSFKIYRSNQPITSQNDINRLIPIATVGTNNQGAGGQVSYSDTSGKPGELYHYAIEVIDQQGNKTLSPLIDPAVSKGYTINGSVISGIHLAKNGETRPYEVDKVMQNGRELYLVKDESKLIFIIEARQKDGVLTVYGPDFHTTDIPYENASAINTNDTGNKFVVPHRTLPVLTMMAPYLEGNSIPDRIQVTMNGTGQIPAVYFNLGADPQRKEFAYQQHRAAAVISKALVGGHNWMEDINEGTNTEDPGAANATAEHNIRIQWNNMMLGYPNKNTLILGSLHQNASVNDKDDNGRFFLRVNNRASELYQFINEYYTVQMGGITDVSRGFVPGDPWIGTYIDQPPEGEGFPRELNNRPISNTRYDNLDMPTEELLAQLAKGLNQPFLIKDNMMNYKIELSIPVKF
ncbi:hypothetical protein IID10_00760 [candidate division KSB1 bacterium]|nr:hypothetical protein [candidate division KSB1 bacterium]